MRSFFENAKSIAHLVCFGSIGLVLSGLQQAGSLLLSAQPKSGPLSEVANRGLWRNTKFELGIGKCAHKKHKNPQHRIFVFFVCAFSTFHWKNDLSKMRPELPKHIHKKHKSPSS